MQNEIPTHELEALIAAEYAALRSGIEERLVPLLVERASRKAAVPASLPGVPPVAILARAPHHEPGAVSGTRSQAPRVKARTAQLVIDALWEAPGHRLPGAALNRIVKDAGYTADAAEKVKGRLRKLGVLIRHSDIGFWSLAPHVLEPGAVIPRAAAAGAENPLEAEGGRAIVEALAAAGEAGLTGGDLLRAAEGRGLPPIWAAWVRGRLRAARRIECNGGPGARWRIAGAGSGTQGERPPASR